MDSFIRKLIREEERAITEVISFMSYNPAIGRVLQQGGVKKFRRLATKLAKDLRSIRSKSCFDELHEKYVRKIIANYETAQGERLSYGQAQKPINVFLKVYVDWTSRPTRTVRNRLIKYLHVPLDSVLISEVRRMYPEWHKTNIRPHLDYANQGNSLFEITKWQYDKWQEFFRMQYPPKPLIFDVV